jgi:hypothetical protein
VKYSIHFTTSSFTTTGMSNSRGIDLVDVEWVGIERRDRIVVEDDARIPCRGLLEEGVHRQRARLRDPDRQPRVRVCASMIASAVFEAPGSTSGTGAASLGAAAVGSSPFRSWDRTIVQSVRSPFAACALDSIRRSEVSPGTDPPAGDRRSLDGARGRERSLLQG